MKVKETAIRLSRHCFLKRTAGRRESRSCGVVRSIMTDSRSVDPGSNPGTSTSSGTHNGLKWSFVGVVRSQCA